MDNKYVANVTISIYRTINFARVGAGCDRRAGRDLHQKQPDAVQHFGRRRDGFNDQNPRDAGAQARPPLEALQEFKLQTSVYSAEYGRLAGGVEIRRESASRRAIRVFAQR